jgi:membrane protein YdbS with pleckstrin-like domain
MVGMEGAMKDNNGHEIMTQADTDRLSGKSMNNVIWFPLIMALCITCPVAGYVSWYYVQDGNWLVAYITAGLSWIALVLAWHLMGRRLI